MTYQKNNTPEPLAAGIPAPTDRELTEAAARAIGMIVLDTNKPFPDDVEGWFFNQVGGNPPALYRLSRPVIRWAPLTDNTDAFLLASDFGFIVDFPVPGVTHVKVSYFDIEVYEPIGADRAAAARRAIVTAASRMEPRA